jgi:hypothetical protein
MAWILATAQAAAGICGYLHAMYPAALYVAIIAASHVSCKEMSRSENFQTAGGKRLQRKKI